MASYCINPPGSTLGFAARMILNTDISAVNLHTRYARQVEPRSQYRSTSRSSNPLAASMPARHNN
jgi:hypothetical protein